MCVQTPEMQGFAVSAVTQAFEAATKEKDIAAFVREKFDKEQGPTWNVIVGRMFGADVTHETKKYCQLTVAELTILIWKSG